jgi:hypothetical protein
MVKCNKLHESILFSLKSVEDVLPTNGDVLPANGDGANAPRLVLFEYILSILLGLKWDQFNLFADCINKNFH